MAFHFDAVFPRNIAYGTKVVPMRRTNITTTTSGHEFRNTPWRHARRRYDVSYGIRTLSQVQRLMEFWESRRGPLYGFKFLDYSDYKIEDQSHVIQPLAEDSDGNRPDVLWQLVKEYGDITLAGASTPNQYVRTIYLPKEVTLTITGQTTPAVTYVVDFTSGEITFSNVAQPIAVKVDAEFYTPARFEGEELDITLNSYRTGEMTSIPLIELRDVS